eukprot:m.197040 g.197040  ORF g.197040 m.197040 type:complete len:303 (+) comp15707_c0_seq1:220-1128(+)
MEPPSKRSRTSRQQADREALIKNLLATQTKIQQKEKELLKKEYKSTEYDKRNRAVERELEKRSDELTEWVNEYRNHLSNLLSNADLKNVKLDPAVKAMVTTMGDKIKQAQSKAKIAREEMTFTRDGNDTARKLLNRSRHFEKENTELEKQLQHGIVSWKKGQLAVLKHENSKLEKSQRELQEYVVQLDDEAVAMEQKVVTLQQQLDDLQQKKNPTSGTVSENTDVKEDGSNPTITSEDTPVDAVDQVNKTEGTSKTNAEVQEEPNTASEITASNAKEINSNDGETEDMETKVISDANEGAPL